jgi:hypothetical protein
MGSPPRKVVTDFAAFGASQNASVFGTAVASTPFSLAGGRAAFGGMRSAAGRGFDAEDDDEEEEGGIQRVELREDSISLEQVIGSLIALICILTIGKCHRLDELQCRVRGGSPELDRTDLHIFILIDIP